MAKKEVLIGTEQRLGEKELIEKIKQTKELNKFLDWNKYS